MQKPLVLLVILMCFAEFGECQKQCELDVPEAKKSKFIKLIKGWFGSLKKTVKDSQDCNDCDAIRPPGQKDVASEKDTKTGCRCNITDNNDKFQCVCCFKLKKWDYLVCTCAGFTLGNKGVFLVVTVEDQVIVEVQVSLEGWWAQLLAKLLSCIPLPPPVAFLSICFKLGLDKPSQANNETWVLCVELKLGILQVPVITIFPKCFNIGGKKEKGRIDLVPQWMKIQGQTDPKVDVADPARSKVIDENYNGVVCLSNFRKKQAGTCLITPTGPDCKPATVELSDKINWKQSEHGETPFLAVLHQQKFPKSVRDVHGDDNKYPYITSALDRAGQEKWMNDDEEVTFEQPGRTCGGAVLTSNKVLTICACVRTFYFIYKLQKDPGEDVIDNPFDIQATDIFVEFSGETYNAAEDYRLEKDEKKFMSDSFCAKHIAQGDTWILQTSMMVMRFEPEIKKPETRQFAPWPPMKIEKSLDVELVGFGMEPVNQTWLFKSKLGKILDFDKNSVNIFMKTCELTDYAKTELQKEPHVSLGGRVSAFCSSDSGFQLCYGKIGLPLTTGIKHRQLVGLSSLPIDCNKEGSTAGAIFNADNIKEIDNYLNCALANSWAWLNLLILILTAVQSRNILNNA